jgi:hypothetical protein
VVFAVRAPVDCEPVRGSAPLQPPLAVQEVALVEDQLNVALLPEVTVLGLLLKLTVGAAAVTVTVVDCDAVPPEPVQVNV